ncbi:DNA repair protein RecO [Gemmatimonadota bacterium]
MSLVNTPAILLRSYPYSETSQILRFYSESLGVVGAMAKGVRKAGGRRGGALATFAQGLLTLYYRDNRDLQTFRDFSAEKTRRGLAGDPLRLAAASVLGELILQHAESEGNPGLFAALSAGLDEMDAGAEDSLLPRLLTQLWGLVRELGYGPVLEECVECGKPLAQDDMGRFDFAAGGLRCPACLTGLQGPRLGPRARAQLRALLKGGLGEALIRPRAHLRLASDFITYHISGGTPLRSMAVLVTLIPKSHA